MFFFEKKILFVYYFFLYLFFFLFSVIFLEDKRDSKREQILNMSVSIRFLVKKKEEDNSRFRKVIQKNDFKKNLNKKCDLH